MRRRHTTVVVTDHGIVDGSDLIRRTHYRLRDDGDGRFEPTDRFFDRLTDAFTRAYLAATGEHALPDHVAAAVDDARARIDSEFADAPDADLPTEVLPRFYRYAAGYHCAYRNG